MTMTSDMVVVRGTLRPGQDPPRRRARPPQPQPTLITGDRLRLADYDHVLRLARFMGARRLPACRCGDCRSVVIGALVRACQ